MLENPKLYKGLEKFAMRIRIFFVVSICKSNAIKINRNFPNLISNLIEIKKL